MTVIFKAFSMKYEVKLTTRYDFDYSVNENWSRHPEGTIAAIGNHMQYSSFKQLNECFALLLLFFVVDISWSVTTP